MNRKPRVEVLVGMIASGKSTYAQVRASEGAVCIDTDTIVTMVHGGDYQGYDVAYKPIYKAIESAAIMSALCAGRDVIVDRTSLTISSRRKYIGAAHSVDAECWCMSAEIDTPQVHAARRAATDGRGYDEEYWEKVAIHHLSTYQRPTKDEGFDDMYWNVAFHKAVLKKD
jgi:predicted kinase